MPPQDPNQPFSPPKQPITPAGNTDPLKQTAVPPQAQGGLGTATPIPAPKSAQPWTANIPAATKPSNKRKIILITVLFVLFCSGLGFGAYTIAKSRVKKADQVAKTEAQTAAVDANFYTETTIKAVQDKISAAKTLAELETAVNEAIYNEPSEKAGIPLGGRAPQVYITQAKIEARTELKKFAGKYTFATEANLPQVKKAVHMYLTEYMRYPKSVSGGFMNAALMGMNISKGGNGEGALNGSTTSQALMMSVEDLSKDASDAEKLRARRLVHHQAWHAHDAIEIVNRAVALRTQDKNISVDDALKKSTAELLDPWNALNANVDKDYTKLPYGPNDDSYTSERGLNGFVTDNAMRNALEDRATIFEYMAVPELRDTLNKMAAKDPIIKKKQDAVRKVFSDYTIDGAKRFFGN